MTNRRRGRAVILAVSAAALLGAGAHARGQATWSYVGPAGGDWNTSLYWSPMGVPGAGDWALFQPGGSGSYTFDGDYSGGALGTLTLGDGSGSTPTLNQSSGTLSVGTETILSGMFSQQGGVDAIASDLMVATSIGASATYQLAGGSLSSTNLAYIGKGGAGTFIQSSGSSNFKGVLIFGDGSGSTGEGSLSGGSLTAASFDVGIIQGAGTFLQSAGSSNLENNVTVGAGTGCAGTISISGGSLTAGGVQIGQEGGVGAFFQSGGSVNFAGQTYVANGAGATGTCSISGGTFLSQDTYVGFSGAGTFIQNGSLTVAQLGILLVGTDVQSGATGTLIMNGGSLSASDAYVGSFQGDGTFNQSGGSSNLGSFIQVGYQSAGTVMLSGGTMTCIGANIGSEYGTGVFLQSGSQSVSNFTSLTVGEGTLAAGTVMLSGGSMSCGATYVGVNAQTFTSGSGTFIQNGGISGLTSSSGTFYIGDFAPCVGVASMSGGSLSAANMIVGNGGGFGTFLQSGGSSNLSTNGAASSGLFLGQGTSSQGTISLTGGTLVAGHVYVGVGGGSGIFLQSGTSSASALNNLILGDGSGSTGVVSVAGGSLSASGTITNVGYSGGSGTFLQSGMSSVSSFGDLVLGNGTASMGVASLSGGSMTVGNTTIGFNGGLGTFVQSGGSSSFNQLIFGGVAGATGTGQITGGMLLSGSCAVGLLGDGTLVQNGTASVSSLGYLNVGSGSQTTGLVLMSGGSLSANGTEIGESQGSGTFLQIGGSSSLGPLIIGINSSSSGTLMIGGGSGSPATLTAGSTSIARQSGVGMFIQGSNSESTLGTVSLGATGTIQVSGGTLDVGRITSSGAIIVSSGTMALVGAGTLGTGSLVNLKTSGSGVVDVGSSGFVMPYSGASPIGEITPNGHTQTYPVNSIQGYIQSAYDGGLWDGPGVSSNLAENDQFGLTAVGALDQNDLLKADGHDYIGRMWMGLSITSDNTVLVRETYYGDTDLNGTVDSEDVNNLELGYAGFGDGWVYGDFNYDGVVDASDVNLLDLNYANVPLGDVGTLTQAQMQWLLATEKGLTAAEVAAFEARVGVPEPVGMGLVGAAAIGMLGRRRRAARKVAG